MVLGPLGLGTQKGSNLEVLGALLRPLGGWEASATEGPGLVLVPGAWTTKDGHLRTLEKSITINGWRFGALSP